MLALATLLTGAFFAAARVLPAAEPAPAATLQGGVAAVEIAVQSEAMGRSMPALVFFPPSYARNQESRYPVLYLLHCAGCDYRTWPEYSVLVDELASRDLIVVCPEAAPRGWYIDSPVRSRSAIETFLIRDLVPRVDREFRTITARSGRALCGFSMGGHGAITLAAKHPDLFVSASSIGGILDLARWPRHWGLDDVLGPLSTNRDSWVAHSAMGLAGRFVKEAAGMQLLIDCGTRDFAMPENRAFHQRLDDLGVKHVYRERAGDHSMDYCSRHLAEHLDFHLAATKVAVTGEANKNLLSPESTPAGPREVTDF